MYLTQKLTSSDLELLVNAHETVFFGGDLKPVTPKPGQWFCEYTLTTLFGSLDVMQDDAIVQYVGEADHVAVDAGGITQRVYHLVAEPGRADHREPAGDILILCPAPAAAAA